ncbi:hypothetical protein ILYODFUR_021425, partial [Ilyodon furcidens]
MSPILAPGNRLTMVADVSFAKFLTMELPIPESSQQDYYFYVPSPSRPDVQVVWALLEDHYGSYPWWFHTGQGASAASWFFNSMEPGSTNFNLELCLDKLTKEYSPGLDTIKMQLYFDMNYTSRSEFLGEIHRVLESKLSKVSREITDSRAKSGDDFQTLYHQIITYILLRSAMGSPTDFSCVQDTN